LSWTPWHTLLLEHKIQLARRQSGGGNFPPLEPRVARLEIRMEHVERDIAEIKADMRSMRLTMDRLHDRMDNDFRITWAGIIAVGVGLAGLMAKGFGWV
jgi:hypothetical protein